MIWPLGAACLWLIAANVIAMLPSRDAHWRSAYELIAAGLPLLLWVALTAGWLAAAVFLVAGASVLRWPVWHLWRWVRGVLRLGPGEG